jgi:phosphoribosylformimino-5-aminoimidazole carboxamide ribotide isomerase
MEIWAAIDLMDGKAVLMNKGKVNTARVVSEKPVELAVKMQEEGVDGLHIVDIDAALSAGENRKEIESIIMKVNIPVQVGGGIRSVRDAKEIIDFGAERIVLGTILFKEDNSAASIISQIGKERIAGSIDYSGKHVMIDGWKKRSIRIEDAIQKIIKHGINYCVITCTKRDGTALGPDIESYHSIRPYLKHVYLFASGGIRDNNDIKALESCGINAVIVGRALYEQTLKPSSIKGVNP